MAANTDTPEFKPYVADETKMPEFTFSALLLGTLLGLVFAASSMYLVLKIGITVSASIPVAVLAITLFRPFGKSILENNIVQTAGSAGESIAFGVGVAMPTLLLIGYSMDLPRIMVVSVLGGLLGILAMIPLRRAFIVKMHGRPGQPGTLLYPEGTACAQVLISGEKGGTTGKTVFIGFGIAFLHKVVTSGMGLLKETVTVPLTYVNKAAIFAQDMASELLGVGYIIGLRTSAIMMAGAVLGYLVIIPIIYMVGEHAPGPVPPGQIPIKDMSIGQLRNNYLLFIGAGTVATAGIISMLKTLPIIVRSLAGGIASSRTAVEGVKRRTENDMPMSVVILGSLGLIVLLALFLTTEVGAVAAIAGAVLVVLFGFLFVTVSSRLTGEIGSSSNPISGMTTATLMLTCLIFLALGWRSSADRLVALSIAAVVCIASSNGGTTAQSLKTGFLVGGTPKAMQYAILIGALVSSLVIGGLLLGFSEMRTIVSTSKENVPAYVLSKDELARLKEKTTFEGKEYLVWHTRHDGITEDHPKENFTARPDTAKLAKTRRAMYFVEPESGKLAAFKDNNIMGELEYRDDGSYVKREFPAPKTQVMGIVINGVLKGDLNWSMILIGALIALMLELAGVSALAFAVGMYVPIANSAPIFVGGIVRFLVDRYLAGQAASEAKSNMERAIAAAGEDPAARMRAESEAKAQAEIDAIRKSETSGGVLLASGYIAGGSLAGVLLGFLAFHDYWPDDMRAWENRSVAVSTAKPLDTAAEELARAELGLTGSSPSEEQAKKLAQLTSDIKKLSHDEVYKYAQVPAGKKILMPDGKPDYMPQQAMLLKDVAKQVFGRERKASAIFDSHAKRSADAKPEDRATLAELKTPTDLPVGAELKLPVIDWSAWAAFGGLSIILLIVGMGWILSAPKDSA